MMMSSQSHRHHFDKNVSLHSNAYTMSGDVWGIYKHPDEAARKKILVFS